MKYNEEIIKKYAEKLFEEYETNSKNWKKRHKERSSIESCLKIAWNSARCGYLPEAIICEKTIKKSKKRTEFTFNSFEKKKKYIYYRRYLASRCEALPRQLERKFKNCCSTHIQSGCYGMSNYIKVEKLDNNGDSVDCITIRISDHASTGSGDPCSYYLYILDYTWMEIKKKVFGIVENFLR